MAGFFRFFPFSAPVSIESLQRYRESSVRALNPLAQQQETNQPYSEMSEQNFKEKKHREGKKTQKEQCGNIRVVVALRAVPVLL